MFEESSGESLREPMTARTVGGVWPRAARLAGPFLMGYLPVGFAYGVLAQKAGLGLPLTVLMSVIVFAGSAQLIAVGLFTAGAGPLTIIATTFVVNLRHVLMSAALSPYLSRWRPASLAALAAELTDESFALHTSRFARGDLDPRLTFAVNAILHVTWVVGSFAGAVAGTAVATRPLALDYALPAMFIALLVAMVRDRRTLLVSVGAGLASTGLVMAGMNDWNVILATVLAATVGTMASSRRRKERQS